MLCLPYSAARFMNDCEGADGSMLERLPTKGRPRGCGMETVSLLSMAAIVYDVQHALREEAVVRPRDA